MSNSNGKGNGKLNSAWSRNELLALKSLAAAGLTHGQIAKAMMKLPICSRKCNANVVQKKLASIDWGEFFDDVLLTEDRLQELLALQEDKKEIIDQTVKNHERLVKRERAKTDLIIDGIRSACFRAPTPKAPKMPTWWSKPKSADPEHVGVMLSDFHVGSSFSSTDTGGIGEFNLDIFRERIEGLKTRLMKIVSLQAKIHKLPHLHVMCLGDIVAGMNESGHWTPNYIDMDVWDQLVAGQRALQDLIATWSQMFEKVTFYGLCGNHGRVGRSGQQKEYTNWDRIAYVMVSEALRDYDNIEWVIPRTWWHQAEILGHTFYMTHGDGIRMSQGVPWYGIERAQSQINAMMGNSMEYCMFAHFHVPAEIQTNIGRIMVNGSLVGGDMYSIRDLRRYNAPEQKIFGIHSRKGVTWTYNLRLNMKSD